MAPTLLQQVDEEFRASTWHVKVPPTRLYVNLTESCNLRCQHCITQAPQLTQSGAARSLTADVLRALSPHLRHVAYVGLTHAGEPMTAPLFSAFLDELSQARGGQATVVHLLTNGQAMTEARFLDAVERGVNSISFSVDGMSAATHDRLRVLSHAGKLLTRIESLARLRREKSLDVRLGLAWTVTRDNAAELPQLIDFVARAGLDWVKLEEVYPLHDVARAELLDGEPLRAAVATAQDHATRLQVKLLDHTREQPVWKCRLHLDDGMARFSGLDDFANRMHINPCALPWQLCCIEPNGDVKPMSFHHPVAGNLLQADLADIFNSGRFSVVRKQALAARLCGRERPSCLVDPGPASW